MDVAVISDGELVADARASQPRGQDAALPGHVEQVLRDAGFSLKDITRLAVVTGPGSFTGLRVGVAYARGLALVRDCPCIGVTSLEASVPLGMETEVLAALSAQKRPPDQTWWVQGVGATGSGLSEVVEAPGHVLADMLVGFKRPVFIDEARGLGVPDTLDVRPLRPSAITAGLKAEVFDPQAHPPSPVYARAPDAALPKT